MSDRRHVRAGNDDRERVAEQLRTAVSEGRIDFEELTERIDLAYAARTLGELDQVVADLPRFSSALPVVSGEEGAEDELQLHTISRKLRQEGRWRVPTRISARVGRGGRVRIDFTTADCPHREVFVDVEVTSWFGDIVIVVPRGWRVDDREVVRRSMGAVHNRPMVPLASDGVIVRLTGHVKTGDVWVRYRRAQPGDAHDIHSTT
ncbi:DUF1707 domain-containing protein [Streptosporangium sp. NPDC002721]|uniref:DUF1707 SHOCT-like domain-containing protein n=1 Tax=Streptosporangium sp. NPDC002721 TaxID=3366188 RepID=UPI0036B1EAED